MIDIDHFKKFNDDFGHIVGDEVLKVLAEIFQQSLRKSDLIARYGGEEFIVLFPETPAEFAVLTADRLRVSVEQTTVTVSIGVAEMPTDGKDMRTVIDMADKRLYEAKHAGRNRVVGPQELDTDQRRQSNRGGRAVTLQPRPLIQFGPSASSHQDAKTHTVTMLSDVPR